KRTAERDAVAGHAQRLIETPAHHRGRAYTVRKARQVDLIQHLPEAGAQFADLPCECALEPNLSTRHRARAELVLQAHDAVAIAAAIFTPPRHREQPQAASSRRRALRTRQDERQVGVGMRAEPLLSVKPPLAVLL